MKPSAEFYYKQLEELLKEIEFIYNYNSNSHSLYWPLKRFKELLNSIKKYFEREYK